MKRAHSFVVTTALLVCGCVEPNPNLANADGATRTSDDEDDTGMMATSSMTTASNTNGDTTASSTTSSTSASSTGDSDTTGSEDDTTDAEPVCDRSTHVCADLPPPNWAGPITLVESTLNAPDPGCSGDYPDHEFTSFADLSAPAAACGCDCTPPAQVTCPNVTLRRYNTNNCSGTVAATNTVATTCTNISSGSGHRQGTANLPGGTACTPVLTENTPDASFLARVTACSAPGGPGCGVGETCLPAPSQTSDGRVCIYAQGDLMCPPNSGYDERVVYHDSFSDNRGCTSCTCGTPQGNCTGNIFIANAVCLGELGASTTIQAGTCSNISFNAQSASWTQTGFTATCSPSGGQPTGDAQPTEPITICCR